MLKKVLVVGVRDLFSRKYFFNLTVLHPCKMAFCLGKSFVEKTLCNSGSDNMQRCNLNQDQLLYSSSFPGCIIACLVLNWIIAHLLDRDRVEHRTAYLSADVCL